MDRNKLILLGPLGAIRVTVRDVAGESMVQSVDTSGLNLDSLVGWSEWLLVETLRRMSQAAINRDVVEVRDG